MRSTFLVLSILIVGSLLITGCSNNGSNIVGDGTDANLAAVSSSAKFGSFGSASSDMDDDDGRPWSDHAHPWDFLWDNGLDNNHEFKVLGNGDVLGAMYIMFTEGDNATGGQNVVGWKVHGKPAYASWSDVDGKWIVSEDEVPHQPGFVHWHPLGDEGVAQGMESAPGYFLKHTATISFYFTPQSRWVEEGIDFDFPMNYMAE